MELTTPFVLFRPPFEEKIYLINDKVEACKPIHSLAINGNSFIFVPFNTSEKQSYIFKANNIIHLREDKIKQLHINIKLKRKEQVSSTKDAYEEQIKTILKAINNNEINKAVLSRIININHHYTTDNYNLIFFNLHKKYPSAFVYMALLPNGNLWCGATPELLASFKNNTFSTIALAGTQTIKKDTSISSIRWQTKEIEEQMWVQKHIEQILRKYSLVYSKSNTETIQAAHLAHISTQYIFTTNKEKVFNIINELHPTPAVCGTPQKNSKALITKVEQHQRSYYSGYLGLVTKNTANLYVNLRCMEISQQQCHLYVGGGITADSNIHNEWIETENKAKVMLKAIEKL